MLGLSGRRKTEKDQDVYLVVIVHQWGQQESQNDEIWLHSEAKNNGNFNLHNIASDPMALTRSLTRDPPCISNSNRSTSALSMGGVDAEPGASSPYDDEEYADDDLEEQDGVPSGKKAQIIAAAGQVRPLDPFSDDVGKLAVGKETDAVRTPGDEVEDDEGNDGEYSDDGFEHEKIAPSVEKAALSAALEETQQQAERDGDAVPGAPVKYSRSNDDADGGDGDAALESSLDSEQQDAALREATTAKAAVDLVTVHAHRTPETVMPPPAPAYRTSTQRNPIAKRQQQELRLSEKRASVAAKRILEYRERQAQREAQQAAEAAASKKKREQFRASNRKVYEQMGVSKLTGEQRYQLLVEEKKLVKQHRDTSAKLEKHQRWYNAKATEPNRKSLALVHVAELQEQYRGKCLRRHRNSVQRSQTIKAHQIELHQQAQAIVAKCTHTQYVRGSYLLKTTAMNPSQPLKASSKSVPLVEAEAGPKAEAENEAEDLYEAVVAESESKAETVADSVISELAAC